MTRRVEDLNQDIVQSLKNTVKNFVFFSIDIDESTDLTDTAQLAIMIRGVNQDFTIVEDFLAESSMKGRTFCTDGHTRFWYVEKEGWKELPISSKKEIEP